MPAAIAVTAENFVAAYRVSGGESSTAGQFAHAHLSLCELDRCATHVRNYSHYRTAT